MDYIIAGVLGFAIGGIIFSAAGNEVGMDNIQESCLIKQEFVVDSVKFKCEMVKPERSEHDDTGE